MQHSFSRTFLRLTTLLVTIFGIVAGCVLANAQTAMPIYRFQGQVGDLYDGASPQAPLTLGSDGTLYGTTTLGGTAVCEDSSGDYSTCGTVFQLTPPTAKGMPWTESVIQSFGGEHAIGYFPRDAALTLDAAGNIYGATWDGGDALCGWPDSDGCGAVFELIRPKDGQGLWTWHVIYEFQPNGAYWPYAGVIFDKKGNLCGTTGYSVGGGAVFKLTPPASGNALWTETDLYDFPASRDGGGPESSLVMDREGDLFGTTTIGGTTESTRSLCVFYNGCGTVFELSPPSIDGNPWTETVLYNFQGGSDGNWPRGVIFGKDDSLYGTTVGNIADNCSVQGGWPPCGTIFRLAPPSREGAPWTHTVLYAFQGGSDGAYPWGNLVFDAEGRLYGTAEYGGALCAGYGCGTIFELTQQGDTWQEKTIYQFGAQPTSEHTGQLVPGGITPAAGLTVGKDGHLYGTASAGGLPDCWGGDEDFPCGTVFEIVK